MHLVAVLADLLQVNMHVCLEKELKFKIKIILLKFYSILINVLTGFQTCNIHSEQTCNFQEKDAETECINACWRTPLNCSAVSAVMARPPKLRGGQTRGTNT